MTEQLFVQALPEATHGPGAPQAQIELLKLEYKRLTDDIRMYTEGLGTKYSVFGTVVIAAIAVGLTESAAKAVFVLIPWLILGLAYFTLSQMFIITGDAARVRSIERRLCRLASAPDCVNWEHVWSPKLIGQFVIELPRKEAPGKSTKLVNPVIAAGAIITLMLAATMFLCAHQSQSLLKGPWSIVNAGGASLLLALAALHASKALLLCRDAEKYEIEEEPEA